MNNTSLITHLSGMGRYMIGQLRLFQGVYAVLQDLHNAAVRAASSLACTCEGGKVCLAIKTCPHKIFTLQS